MSECHNCEACHCQWMVFGLSSELLWICTCQYGPIDTIQSCWVWKYNILSDIITLAHESRWPSPSCSFMVHSFSFELINKVFILTRVSRVVGGWAKRAKKCLTPSKIQNSYKWPIMFSRTLWNKVTMDLSWLEVIGHVLCGHVDYGFFHLCAPLISCRLSVCIEYHRHRRK